MKKNNKNIVFLIKIITHLLKTSIFTTTKNHLKEMIFYLLNFIFKNFVLFLTFASFYCAIPVGIDCGVASNC